MLVVISGELDDVVWLTNLLWQYSVIISSSFKVLSIFPSHVFLRSSTDNIYVRASVSTSVWSMGISAEPEQVFEYHLDPPLLSASHGVVLLCSIEDSLLF